MLDRIRRKLFLSVKVMGGSGQPQLNENNSQLGRFRSDGYPAEGSSALSQSGGMDLSQFLDAPIATDLGILEREEGVRDAKIKQELRD